MVVLLVHVRVTRDERRDPRHPCSAELSAIHMLDLVYPEPPVVPNLSATRRADLASLSNARVRTHLALASWDAATASHPIHAILSLCADPGPARDALGATLLAALEAALPLTAQNPSRSVELLSACLCFATRRLKDADGATDFAGQLLPAVQAAIATLLVPEVTSPASFCVTGEGPERALSGLLEALVASVGPGKAAAANRVSPIHGDGVKAIVGLLVRRGIAGRAGLLRALATSSVLHAAAADALAVELRAGGERASRCVSVLSALAARLREGAPKEQPGEAVHTLGFLVAASRRAPLALLAGVDSGSLRASGAWVDTLPAAQRSGAHKLAVDLLCGLCTQNLPVRAHPASVLSCPAPACIGDAPCSMRATHCACLHRRSCSTKIASAASPGCSSVVPLTALSTFPRARTRHFSSWSSSIPLSRGPVTGRRTMSATRRWGRVRTMKRWRATTRRETRIRA